MFEKRLKAVDLAKGTNIAPSVISRYLSGQNQPSRDNIITIGNYLDAHPQSLLSSSDAPESIQKNQAVSSVTDPLLKQIEDKEKIIAVQEELIKNLQKQVMTQSHYINALFKELGEAKIESKERHAKGREKTKNPTKPKKRKVGFIKKHKKSKS
ncbi:helix-turn-helix transcriptional regulator [Nitrospinaceae bacterium]|nr:helix-turn-helix transcriptional regulator [Nitrospinaceae bacterium]